MTLIRESRSPQTLKKPVYSLGSVSVDGHSDRAVHLSGIKHGTPIAMVHEDIGTRRRARVDETKRHPHMGRRKVDHGE